MTDFMAYMLASLGTLLVYYVAWVIYQKSNHNPLLHPLISAVIMVIIVLSLSGIDYESYFHYAQPIHLMLGPIVVALGFAIAEHIHVLKGHALALSISLVAGSLFSIATVWAVTAWVTDDPILLATYVAKSVTSPIAVPLVQDLGGLPGLAAVVVLATGTVGAVFGPWLLRSIGLDQPLEMGMAIGVASHGIGAAEMLRHNSLAGAAAGLAMGLNGLLTAILLPIFW